MDNKTKENILKIKNVKTYNSQPLTFGSPRTFPTIKRCSKSFRILLCHEAHLDASPKHFCCVCVAAVISIPASSRFRIALLETRIYQQLTPRTKNQITFFITEKHFIDAKCSYEVRRVTHGGTEWVAEKSNRRGEWF